MDRVFLNRIREALATGLSWEDWLVYHRARKKEYGHTYPPVNPRKPNGPIPQKQFDRLPRVRKASTPVVAKDMWNSEARKRVIELYLQGLTYAQIGKELGFSRQRAQQYTRPRPAVYDIILRRANGKCEHCENALESGHIHHVRVGQTVENFNTPDMLLYLCVGCHRKAEFYVVPEARAVPE